MPRDWDPALYLRHADERTRPMADLVARVAVDARTVVDLGSGPGHLTPLLRALARGLDHRDRRLTGHGRHGPARRVRPVGAVRARGRALVVAARARRRPREQRDAPVGARPPRPALPARRPRRPGRRARVLRPRQPRRAEPPAPARARRPAPVRRAHRGRRAPRGPRPRGLPRRARGSRLDRRRVGDDVPPRAPRTGPRAALGLRDGRSPRAPGAPRRPAGGVRRAVRRCAADAYPERGAGTLLPFRRVFVVATRA